MWQSLSNGGFVDEYDDTFDFHFYCIVVCIVEMKNAIKN